MGKTKKLGTRKAVKDSSYCVWCEGYTGGAALCEMCKLDILSIIDKDCINRILKRVCND